LQTIEGVLGALEGIAQEDIFVVAGPSLGILEFDLPELGLDLTEAAEEPIGGNQGMDEDTLLRCDGLEAILVAGGEGFEIRETLTANDERLGINAGFQGILRRGGLTLGGARAGRFLGVSTVGVGLAGGRHEFPSTRVTRRHKENGLEEGASD
jgi:hypothetical protein